MAGCYLVQQPEPQQPTRSASAPLVGHSATQHSQVQRAHVQVPVSQQLQQSHFGQPPACVPVVAGKAGTRPSIAQTNRLFMENLLGSGSDN